MPTPRPAVPPLPLNLYRRLENGLLTLIDGGSHRSSDDMSDASLDLSSTPDSNGSLDSCSSTMRAEILEQRAQKQALMATAAAAAAESSSAEVDTGLESQRSISARSSRLPSPAAAHHASAQLPCPLPTPLPDTIPLSQYVANAIGQAYFQPPYRLGGAAVKLAQPHLPRQAMPEPIRQTPTGPHR